MILATLLALVSLAVAAPAARITPGIEAYPAWLCSKTNFRGFCNRVYADQKCVNLPEPLNGNVSSMIQWTHYLCDFYSDADCEFKHARIHGDYQSDNTNGVAIKWVWDMGSFDGKMKSVYCKASVDMSDTAEIPSPDEVVQHREVLDAGLIQTPGVVSVFSEPGFAGTETPVDALARCSQTFVAGAIKSLKQQQGAVCHYYQSPSCAVSNHVPALRHDSAAAAWDAADLGEWAGKIKSFECETADAHLDVLAFAE